MTRIHATKWSVAVLYVAAIAFIFSNLSTLQDYCETAQRKADKQAYAEFVNNHEFAASNTPTLEEIEAMPKYDRPDLANQQEFLMTMDPATGDVPRERLIHAFRIVDEFKDDPSRYAPGDPTLPWTERGPDNIGGRTRALMWDPNVTNQVWAGGVAGGLWYNTDITGTGNWTVVDDFWSNLAVSCIDYDPTNTQVMYVGTGEGWFNGDATRGLGIWKTTDGGATWAQLASTNNSTFHYVQDIRVHPVTGDVYAATRTNGVQRSQDGGTSWSTVLNSSDPNSSTSRAADIEIGADNDIYVAMGIFSTGDIFRSSTGNSGSWTHLSPGGNGFPTTGVNRIEMACAPSNANVVYAVTQSSGTFAVEGMYYSSDKGANWSSLTLPTDADGGVSPTYTRTQAWYDLILQVDPNDADHVYTGGIDIFHSFDAGGTWQQISHWYGGFGFPYIHADQHAIAFKNGSSTEVIFGNDGGVTYTANGNIALPTVTERNQGYNVTQFYGGAMNPNAGSNVYLAGSQDNGTQYYSSPGMNSTTEPIGGDGAYVHIDQNNASQATGAYVYSNYYRSFTGGSTFGFVVSDNSGRFINPTDLDNNLDILYGCYSGTTLRRYSDFFGTIAAASLTTGLGSQISALTVSPHTTTSSTVFVADGSGNIRVVTNADGASSNADMDPSGTLPNAYINCIEVGQNENELLVTYTSYGVQSVWYTSDGGTTWVNKEGNLPDMPIRWALFNPDDYNEVIVATDVGVWSTGDISVGSPTWVPSNTGLANARVDMLQKRTSDNQVLAVTHGRGVYTGFFFTPTTTNDAGISATAVPQGQICGDTFIPEVTLMNHGAATLTSVDIIYDVDGGGSSTFNWTGSILAGNSATVVLPSITETPGAHTFNVATNLPNGVADDDTANDANSSAFTINDTWVDVIIVADRWGCETTWEIRDAALNLVASGGPYTCVGTNGEYPQPAVQVCLESTQCYDFTIFDSYGDGMCCAYGNGSWEIQDTQGGTLITGTLNDSGGPYPQVISLTTNFCPPAPPSGNTYYSVASGNMSGNIWSLSPTGTGGPGTFDCTTNIVVQNGNAVTNDIGDFQIQDFEVEPTGSFDMGFGGNRIMLCGDVTLDGTYTSNDSRMEFIGSALQMASHAGLVVHNEVMVNNAAGVQLDGDQRIMEHLDIQSGVYTVNSGITTFGANATQTGRLLELGPGADYVGDMNAELYVSSSSQGWRMMGMSVDNGDLQEWNDDIPTTGFPGSDFPAYNFVNILDYDETLVGLQAHYDSGFFAPTGITDVVGNGHGRFVYMTGLPLTLAVDGAPVKGPVTVSVDYTNSATVPFNDGWRLAANSYQCTADWESLTGWTRTNIDNSIYSWDNDLQQWATYTLGGVGVNGGSRYIAPQQGLWIKANAAGPAFAYDEPVKVDQYVQFVRDNEEFYQHQIMLSVVGNGYSDQSAIVLREGASSGFDNAYDGYKLTSSNEDVPSLYTMIEQDEIEYMLAINSYGQFEAGTAIALHFEAPAEEEYILSTNDFETSSFGACLVLEDLLTGELTTLDPGLDYTFTANPEDDSHRFNILIGNSVELSTEHVTCAGDFNGSATASGSGDGPFDYYWYDEGGNLIASSLNQMGEASISDLGAGNYSVVVDNGTEECASLERVFELTQPASQSMSIVASHEASCNQDGHGWIELELNDDQWQIIVNKDGAQYDAFDFEGTQLNIGDLGPGVYEVVAISDCGTEHETIDLNDAKEVLADFTAPLETEINSPVNFENMSENATSFMWTIGAQNFESQDLSDFIFAEEGLYQVSLYASNNACFDEHIEWIDVIGEANDIDAVEEDWMNLIYNANEVGVEILADSPEGYAIQLIDIQGKVIDSKNCISSRTMFSMNSVAGGVYTLSILLNGERVHAEKVFLNR